MITARQRFALFIATNQLTPVRALADETPED